MTPERTACRDPGALRRLPATPHPDVLSGALRGGETLQDGRARYALKGELDMAGGESLVRRVTGNSKLPETVMSRPSTRMCRASSGSA